MRETLLHLVQQATNDFTLEAPDAGPTAEQLAQEAGCKRNTASHYLNQLVAEGFLLKINTRPVIFLHRELMEKRFGHLANAEYSAVAELKAEIEERPSRHAQGMFAAVTGAGGSLRNVLEQLKAAALYPGQGLPVIFDGPTGVGKSYLARVMYEYCREEGILQPNAPYVVFNCAQYVNNPELLTANLFGYVKGAFTGADKNKVGAFEAADGGILFLDEIHRLSPEGQEKLFIFMDEGRYQRLGENDTWHTANVRLLFATTEPLEDVLLATFLRRIPISITLPELEKRGADEKALHIFAALLEEARQSGKPIEISGAALNALISHYFKGSIGELRNTIKSMFAGIYAGQREKEILRISLYNLPDAVLGARQQPTAFAGGGPACVRLYPGQTPEEVLARISAPHKGLEDMFADLAALCRTGDKNRSALDLFYTNAYYTIQATLVQMLAVREGESLGRRYRSLLDDVHAAFSEVEVTRGYRFDESGEVGIACYFYHRAHYAQFMRNPPAGLHELRAKLKNDGIWDASATRGLITTIARRLDTELSLADEVFLSLYMHRSALPASTRVRVLVVARGFTSQSIATLVNARLKAPVVEWMDLPFRISEEEAIQRIIDHVVERGGKNGLFIMADIIRMDSLTRRLDEIAAAQLLVTNSLSAQLAYEAARVAMDGQDLNAMWRHLPKQGRPMFEMVYPKEQRQKAIIACCVTGTGTAGQLKTLLESSIPKSLNVAVMVQDLHALTDANTSAAIFQLFEVIAIVGTADMEMTGVPFASLEQLISGEGEAVIRMAFSSIADEETVSRINNDIVKNFSLYSVVDNLTILDTEKMMQNVEEVLTALESLTGKPLPNDKKINLYVHLSCMVERLVRQEPLTAAADGLDALQCQEKDIKKLKSALSVLEGKYSVKIPDSELAYILDILQLATNISGRYL